MINVIKKAIEELKKDSPRLEYILGLLETLVEMNEPIKTKEIITSKVYNPNTTVYSLPKDPIESLDIIATANLDKVKRMSGESTII